MLIDGRDFTQGPPYNTDSAVSLWEQQLAHENNKIVCQLNHGTEVEIIRKENCSKVRDTFFYIQNEDCKGWIAEITLRTQYKEIETQTGN